MSLLVVVPLRSFRLGKTRLAAELSDERRQMLGSTLAETVSTAIREAGLTAAVVTADDEVAEWASLRGHLLVDDPGTGLDAACRAGVMTAPRRWAVVHGDLPLVSGADMEFLADLVRAGRDVIAPSSDGGTTVLSARGPIEFAYGPASFHRHLPQLDDPVVVARRGLLHDLDSIADFESAARAGAW